MRLPQIVKRSISSRSFLGVLCFSSEAPCASPSSSLGIEGAGCSASGSGVGGWLAGAAGGASVGGGGNKSVLGVGWVVTEEEEEEDGVLQGGTGICSTFDSPEGAGHVAWSALLGLLADEDGAVEGLSNSLSSMLALLT